MWLEGIEHTINHLSKMSRKEPNGTPLHKQIFSSSQHTLIHTQSSAEPSVLHLHFLFLLIVTGGLPRHIAGPVPFTLSQNTALSRCMHRCEHCAPMRAVCRDWALGFGFKDQNFEDLKSSEVHYFSYTSAARSWSLEKVLHQTLLFYILNICFRINRKNWLSFRKVLHFRLLR